MRSKPVSLFLGITMFFCTPAFSQQAQFNQHPEVNEKFENFSQALVEGLFPELNNAELKLARDASGEVTNDLVQGKISSTLSAQLEDGSEISEVIFDLNLSIDVEPEKKKEYRIHMLAQGEITNSDLLMETFSQRTLSQCGSKPAPTCELASSLQEQEFSLDHLYQSLEGWKQEVLAQVANIQDSKNGEFAKIRNDFLAYMDERIQISQSDSAVLLNINFSDLAEIFRDEAGNWLNDNDLIDYSLQKVIIEWTEEKTLVDIHFQKLHVMSAFNAYMQIAKEFQDTFEDPKAGGAIGEALRKKPTALKNSFSSNAHLSDKASALAAGVKLKLGGEVKNKQPTQEEIDLGLD